MKHIVVHIPGRPNGQNIRELAIEEGTTARHLLEALGLDPYGYCLACPQSNRYLDPALDLDAELPDRAKLQAWPIDG